MTDPTPEIDPEDAPISVPDHGPDRDDVPGEYAPIEDVTP